MKKRRCASGEPQKWLLSHVNFRGEECLIWPFGHNGVGYAQVTWGGSPVGAHRIMCLLAHGDPKPDQKEVAHRCGNKSCVNPSHLRHATWKENSADKIAHGRENFGEKNGQAKLTLEDVAEIKRLYSQGGLTQTEIGTRFGVQGNSVCRIISGKRWAVAASMNSTHEKRAQ